MARANTEPYLLPYQRAADRHGAAFQSLLWASPTTQRLRFEAIRQAYPVRGKSVLDAGCGRADFLAYLIELGDAPAEYIGIEAVEALAAAGESRRHPNCKILRADFVSEPARLFVGADVVTFSGSLNTMDGPTFYSTIRRAFDAATEALVFNFLCSPSLAGKDYLAWHAEGDVLRFCRTLGKNVRSWSDYLPGDCTIALVKPDGM